ncbi:MAG TPA: metalloregulator ArsR/SmtB family transcription factor [Thermoleophilaceae bacterium]|nr:metalloregulator ArsR/SmtB family transcription factor [Thermoleophilaceae bacterium]
MISIVAAKHQTETLAALAHEVRLGIVTLLASRPHTATEIHDACDIAAPAVSRHLRVLREAGLIEERRPDDDRRVRIYTLRTESIGELASRLDELSRGWQAQLDSFKDFVALRTERAKDSA